MTLTYYGHSAVQIETDGTTILVDPFITGNPHCEGVVEVADLSPDVVLLTHAHGDHYGDTEALVEQSAPLVVSNFEITQYVTKQTGHESTHPMNTGGAWSFDWGRVTNTDARHSSSFPDGTYGGLAGGFVLEAEGRTVYLAGDTALFGDMARLGERFDIDLAFLPIGDCLTMGPDDALEAARRVGARRVVPIHYDTFPIIPADPEAFAETLEGAGIGGHALRPGESLSL